MSWSLACCSSSLWPSWIAYGAERPKSCESIIDSSSWSGDTEEEALKPDGGTVYVTKPRRGTLTNSGNGTYAWFRKKRVPEQIALERNGPGTNGPGTNSSGIK
uniref:Putative secreted protein n=1 Tax=Ixodes ricinus TaxID=34613 RepID=A0A6B0UFJ9_IXORI